MRRLKRKELLDKIIKLEEEKKELKLKNEELDRVVYSTSVDNQKLNKDKEIYRVRIEELTHLLKDSELLVNMLKTERDSKQKEVNRKKSAWLNGYYGETYKGEEGK